MIIGANNNIYIVDHHINTEDIDKMSLNGEVHDIAYILELDKFKYVWSLNDHKCSGIVNKQYPMNLIERLRDINKKAKPLSVLLKMDISDHSNQHLLIDLISNTRGILYDDKSDINYIQLLIKAIYNNYIGDFTIFGKKDKTLVAL